jgi:tetratricopeptide (TPR) repeat protein
VQWGRSYISVGRYDEAGLLLERALALQEKALKEDDVQLAETRYWLAFAYRESERAEEALKLYHLVLPVFEAVHGPESYETACVWAYLGGTYMYLEQHDKAEPCYTKALAVLEANAKRDPIVVGRCYNGLSEIAAGRGEFDKARSLVEKARALYEQHLPPGTPWRLGWLLAVADIDTAEGKYADAEARYTEALEGIEKTAGPDSKPVAEALDKMKHLYEKMGQPDKATACADRAAAIRAKLEAGKTGAEEPKADAAPPEEQGSRDPGEDGADSGR